jgi:hypothetical protein
MHASVPPCGGGRARAQAAMRLAQFAQFRDMLMEAWRRAMEKPERVAMPPAIPNHTRLGIQ